MRDDVQRGVLHPAADVVWRRVQDSGVLVDLRTNQIYELNETGTRVWELMSEGQSIASVLDQLRSEYEVESSDTQSEVEHLVEELESAGLLERKDG